MSSDFAISRFKHLRKLLLVHGHWCGSRLANMMLYFFYKNVVRLGSHTDASHPLCTGHCVVVVMWAEGVGQKVNKR